MSVHIKIVLDGRRPKKSQKYPTKLRVTLGHRMKYYPTIFDLTKEDYGKLKSNHLSQELRKVGDIFKSIEVAATLAVQEMYPFAFLEFEREFVAHNKFLKLRQPKDGSIVTSEEFDFEPFFKKFPVLLEKNVVPGTVRAGYINYIKRPIKEGRIGTAVTYHCSIVSLRKFRRYDGYSDITPTFLTQYEQWLKGQGISKTTVGIYLRPLRCIFNEAIIDGYIKKERCYPFGRRKYQIPTGRNVKKALSEDDIKKIYYYECDPKIPGEQKAKDFWFFSYFANGMNIQDVVKLRRRDIYGDYLIYERAKTEKTMRSDPKVITVFINDDMRVILERWGSKEDAPDSYIFSILKLNEKPLDRYRLVQPFL
jgi:integrase/recombinase XerD